MDWHKNQESSSIDQKASPATLIFENVISPAKSIVKSVSSPAKAIVKDVSSPAKSIVEGVGSPAESIVKGVGSPAKSIVEGVGSPAKSIVEGVGSPAESIVKGVGSPKESIVKGVGSPAKSIVKDVGSPAKSIVKGVGSPAKSIVKGVGSPAKYIVKDVSSLAESIIKGVGSPAKSIVKGVGSPAKSIIKGVSSPAKSIIKDVSSPAQPPASDESSSLSMSESHTTLATTSEDISPTTSSDDQLERVKGLMEALTIPEPSPRKKFEWKPVWAVDYDSELQEVDSLHNLCVSRRVKRVSHDLSQKSVQIGKAPSHTSNDGFFVIWFSDSSNYCERIRWLLLLLPLVGTFWGSLSIDSFFTGLQLVLMVGAAYIAGTVVGACPRMPPLLGMMIAGGALSNFGLVTIPPDLTAKLRSLAFAVILLRAGAGIDLPMLWKLLMACVKLTLIPCSAEAFGTMVVAHFLLDLPYLWSLLLGFVMSAVSPAVVVPAMIDLAQRKLGTAEGIPTLVITAASFDDVAAITGFGIVLGMIFQQSESGLKVWTILTGPLQALVGLTLGIILGIFTATTLRAYRQGTAKKFDFLCPCVIVLFGVCAIFVSTKLGFGVVGPLVAITSSAVAIGLWKWQSNFQNMDDVPQIWSTTVVLKYLWIVFEPVLFSMIGTEIHISELKKSLLLKGAASLGICLVIRVCFTFLAVSCSPLKYRERFFVCVAWLPKATVQAALAPTALDIVRTRMKENKPVGKDALAYSETVSRFSVLFPVLRCLYLVWEIS
ncbi:mitochondrial sodium/hydrogen exchanger 9B2-like [Tropilaelaps mercedesae]|uniref:Mitochondrial sodium/hydrogen exchanger 9B2-like n=1 Tax=Tropilaelaps mercedesae TaxID=418985 RepID=A0A1V9X6X6_9ACAR|nr:mitochondrial sodium/hydrogen exchanger 9B2-like [Tropilaelaps mercedesae]